MTPSAPRAMCADRSDLAREDHLKPTPTDREAGELLVEIDRALGVGS